MAHFYGIMWGNGKELTRQGTANSGIVAKVAGAAGAVQTRLYNVEGIDKIEVTRIAWEGQGETEVLYTGTLGPGAPYKKETK
jgi:hypothetical protein